VTPFVYGASFVDRATGLRFEMHHPASRPDLWHAYIEGLVQEYARYGIEGLVDRRTLEATNDVSLFFVGIDADDHVVTGLRCHGPLDDAAAAYALEEVAKSPEIDDYRSVLESASPYGVVEIKGGWRRMSGDGNAQVIQALVRCCAHAMEWLGAEVLLLAVADRMEPLMTSIGSIKMGLQSAPFPSEQYRTILTRMRRTRYGGLIDDAQAKRLREDREQLERRPVHRVTTGWRPILLDVGHRADRQILANLRTDAGTHVLDVADRQREELGRIVPPPGPELLDEPPVHVYYPWRDTVVRMLGPLAFAAVRLDRNRHLIRSDEQDRLRRQRVGIVGLSAGHSAATTIALEGLCGELRLADFDEVELSNLNRLPASVLDIGTNKAVLAARRVAELDPYLRVRVVSDGLRSDNAEEFVAGLDVLVEECDDLAMKLHVREVARRQRVAVVMETSDRGMLDVERFDDEPDRPLLHGLLGDVDAASLASLSVSEKVPYVLAIVDVPETSPRAAASLAEVGRTLSTWPQLGSEVTLGGAAVAAAVRRLGLGEPLPSGRTRVDLDARIASLAPPATRTASRQAGEPSAAWAAEAAGEGAEVGGARRGPAGTARLPADPEVAVAYAASLAASCGNGQPWTFELATRNLAILVERSRSCGAMDVRSRASYVSIGAALFNARVAAAAASRLGAVELFPMGPSSEVVATLGLGNAFDEALAELYQPMVDRCSNRRHGVPAPLDLSLVARLTRAASLEGASLSLVTDRDRLSEVAELLRETERIRFLTPALLEETIRELRWPGEDVRTGIDVATLELGPSELAAVELMRRRDVMELLERWDAGDALGDYLRTALLSSSAVAVITVESSAPTAYVTGGMAFERVWIEAQRAGLAVQAIGPAFLYAVQQSDYEALGGTRWAGALRDLQRGFRDLLGLSDRTVGILVLRLSHAPAPTVRSERLPLTVVLRRQGARPSA
jgi:molybdopterin/thiamine biosynthesis adenylyltransferase